MDRPLTPPCSLLHQVGTVTLAQFQDDTQRSRLRTLLARLTPTEVLLEHGQHTAETAGTLRLVAPRAAYELLRGDEMPSADEARRRLQAGKYFPEVSACVRVLLPRATCGASFAARV